MLEYEPRDEPMFRRYGFTPHVSTVAVVDAAVASKRVLRPECSQPDIGGGAWEIPVWAGNVLPTYARRQAYTAETTKRDHTHWRRHSRIPEGTSLQ